MAGFADATGRFLPLVCTMNATRVTDAVARLLDVDFAGLDELALAAPAGAGSRPSLTWRASARRIGRSPAALTGIRTDVTPELLARAAVEGVVCNLLAGAAALGRRPRDSWFLIGGAARSAAYRRVVADLTARVVVVPSERELVAAGAAVQAGAVRSGVDFQAVAEAWQLGRGDTVEPDRSIDAAAIREACYQAARATQ